MKLKIQEINTIALGLGELMEIPMKGGIRFKIIHNAKKTDDVLKDAIEANNGDINLTEDIAKSEANIEFELFDEEDFDDITVQPKVLMMISPIIVETEIKGAYNEK